MRHLFEELEEYGAGDVYPFHMPGHKRNRKVLGGFFPVEEDITEITGFDNLHHAEGLIREAQERGAKLFGAKETFFSVNGSTGALLAAISAATTAGGKILMARNCHKAVYHAVYLRNLQPVYIYPHGNSKLGINGGTSAANVERILESNPEIQAVIITSPTYDGVVSDVRRIAEAAHKNNIPLIVDEAHGAHFAFSEYFPESAVSLGADLVIQSVHKTLPSMTQTALLHKCTDRVDTAKIERFLDIYETSSPSYVLMGSIDACIQILQEKREDLFRNYTENLEWARTKLKQLSRIHLVTPEPDEEDGIFDYDRSKIILSLTDTNLSGTEFHDLLRNYDHLELEMDALHYVLALTSLGDTREGFERLVDAVQRIDQAMENHKKEETEENELWNPYLEMKQILSLSEALDRPGKWCELREAVGMISGEFVMIYPPGIPLIAPGEQISGTLVRVIEKCRRSRMNLLGLKQQDEKTYIWITEK